MHSLKEGKRLGFWISSQVIVLTVVNTYIVKDKMYIDKFMVFFVLLIKKHVHEKKGQTALNIKVEKFLTSININLMTEKER